jgi:sRNA-binding protein
MTKHFQLDMLPGIARLAEVFPKAFFTYEARRKPLKVGIHDDIRAVLSDAMDDRELGAVLNFYCNNEGYLRRCVTQPGSTSRDLPRARSRQIRPNTLPSCCSAGEQNGPGRRHSNLSRQAPKTSRQRSSLHRKTRQAPRLSSNPSDSAFAISRQRGRKGQTAARRPTSKPS